MTSSIALNIFIGMALTALLGFLVAKVIEIKANLPHYISLLPKDIQNIVEAAAKFGSEYVEKLDENGQLKIKGEEKLNMAVDFAVNYVEGLIGVDIDQELIKNLIQKYVFDNPQLFPSKGE